MRVIVFVKATKDSEAGVMPSKKLIAAMGAYNQSLIQGGFDEGRRGSEAYPGRKACPIFRQ
jgi:hypothetical protein